MKESGDNNSNFKIELDTIISHISGDSDEIKDESVLTINKNEENKVNVIINIDKNNEKINLSQKLSKYDNESYDKMHTCGRVLVQDKVEIGAGTTIDRGITGDTTIGEGTKIDNHVHIGHDSIIGKNCLFAAQVGIAGCVIIEDEVTLWGQVGTTSGITIGEKAVVLGKTGVTKSIPGGKTYFGSPCGEAKDKFREMAAVRQLPKILDKL